MIKFRQEFFITLLVALCLVTAEARHYPPKPILRGGNAEVLYTLLRGNENPEISTVLSPKSILRIGNPEVDTPHRNKPKPALFAGGYPKAVIDIGNPAVATLLRDNARALRGSNSEISAMLRDNPKLFLLAGTPEISATPRVNPKPNPLGGSSKLLALLREYTKPLLNNPALLRVGKHSDNNLVPISGINRYPIKDNDLKETFNRMIETVAKVNDERIQSLKKFFELQNYLPQVSRTTLQKNPIIAIIMNTPNYKANYDNINIKKHLTEDPIVKKKYKEPNMLNMLKEVIEGTYLNHDDKVSISQESDDDETRITKNFYLRGWNGCKKSAAKYCRKACDKALKYVCNDYQCSKSFKKDGKKQCKKRCNAEFIDEDGYSSE